MINLATTFLKEKNIGQRAIVDGKTITKKKN